MTKNQGIHELKDFQIEAIHRKVSSILLIFLGLVLIAALGVVAKFGNLAFIGSKKSDQASQGLAHETRKIAGSLACLPLKDGVVKSCEYGIKTSNGEYYAVSGMSLQAAYGKASSSGIEVSGEFIAAGDREKHNIVGTILAE